ncbi:MAG: imidazole glycerol phosphate synthase subunit HisF [Candidatus Aenigmarchaeota archaeon]|nr:imidazole glycerol phosphate synthase subunit HisF [Candidatus Aenigmarchaeota archaeon]
MLGTRVFPCLLLRNSSLVKTIKFENPRYIGDPINTVIIYNEKEVDELVFLDITATTENRKPNFQTISEIASECFMPFAYGGGIKTLDDIKQTINLGAEKAVINTQAIKRPQFIKDAASFFGSQSVIVAIDIKKNHLGEYRVYSHSEKKLTGLDPVEFAVQMENLGAGEIFLNSVDRDGTMEGYDLELIKKVSEPLNIPIVACGGAGNIKDIGAAIKAGASAVAAGSIFIYQGKNRSVLINFPTKEELKEVLET